MRLLVGHSSTNTKPFVVAVLQGDITVENILKTRNFRNPLTEDSRELNAKIAVELVKEGMALLKYDYGWFEYFLYELSENGDVDLMGDLGEGRWMNDEYNLIKDAL